MGWLRDHNALKISDLRERSAAPFDDVLSLPDEVVAEQQAWREEEDRRLVAQYHLARQVVREMEARDKSPRRRGRPAYLPSYADYKRVAAANWLTFISGSATNLSQEQLARELGFENKKKAADGARLLRFVKNGTKGKAGGQNRMPTGRMAIVEAAIRKHRWDKRGCINFSSRRNAPFSPERFEMWAREVAAMTLGEYRKSCEGQERAAWEHGAV